MQPPPSNEREWRLSQNWSFAQHREGVLQIAFYVVLLTVVLELSHHRKPRLRPWRDPTGSFDEKYRLNAKNPPSRDEIAALFKVNRSTLYRALAG